MPNMRIIGGTYRGKKLISPNYEGVRPTSDRTREAVFNILYSLLPQEWGAYRLLEVFTGSGAFSLEAISRGVSKVCMVDLDLTAAQKNVALFPKESDKLKLLKADGTKLPEAKEKYNLYFSDAPYNQNLSEKALAEAAEKGWLEQGAVCVIEVHKSENLVPPAGFDQLDERIYGIAKILIFKYIGIE